MLIKNFLLSKAKSELSPKLRHLTGKKGKVNRAIKKVMKEIDSLIFEEEGMTTELISIQTPRRYQALQTILSYLVHEGFSCAKQVTMAKKAGISKPLINETLSWLENLGLCQQIKTRNGGKKGPSVYILTIHNNYLDILSYFRQKWYVTIEPTETVSKLFQKKKDEEQNKKESEETEIQEKQPKTKTKGLRYFDLNTSSEALEDLEEHASSDQKRAFNLAKLRFEKHSDISEEDCYKIAMKMPKSMDKTAFDAYCSTLESLNVQASSIDHIAAWVKRVYEIIHKSLIQKPQQKQMEPEPTNSFNLIRNSELFAKTLGIKL
ncbi:hypothetical protein ACQVTS_28205 [Bacillus mycoides]|uniref:hypothetical protein n=1 Tax=Bacillus mycoides TaxID=1405 RepID=UPI003D651AB8